MTVIRLHLDAIALGLLAAAYAVGARGTLVIVAGLALAAAGFVTAERVMHRRRRDSRRA